MKILCAIIAVLSFTNVLKAQQDSWAPIETNGFGSTLHYGVNEFTIFKDTLYASIAQKGGPGIALIYRSASGDVGSWDTVTYDPVIATVKGIPSFGNTDLGGGVMWMATGDITQGTRVYRTTNGTDWMPISDFGFGNAGRWSPTPHMVVYQAADGINYLYAAANTHGGGIASEVWRIPYDSTNVSDWELVVDFDIRDPNCTQVTYFYERDDILYFGSNGDSLLYESANGTDFIANADVQASFHPADLLIACMIEFSGHFYCTTNNPATGGKLWRSADMINWENMTDSLVGNGYDPNRDFELHNLDTSNGYLWITSYTDTANSNGCPIWRSTDASGTSFIQSNIDGFGNPNVDGENSVTIGFQGKQYFGGPNHFEGGQIWRTEGFAGVSHSLDNCQFTLYPNPLKQGAPLYLEQDCQDGTSLIISDLSGKVVYHGSAETFKVGSNELNLKTGQYIVMIQGEFGISYEKLIVY